MLRAIKLETSGSGTYYNLSPGLIDTSNFFVNVDELVLNHQVQIMPNPGSGFFEISFDEIPNSNWTLNVLDIKGSIVFENTFAPTNKQAIDLSGLANGVYVLKIVTEEGIAVKKVVKEN